MNRNGHTTLSPHSKLLVPNHQQSNFVFPQESLSTQANSNLTIRLPPSMPLTRRSARNRVDSNASGSEYHVSNASMDVDEEEQLEEPAQEEEREETVFQLSQRGRKIKKATYNESSEGEGDAEGEDELDVIDRDDERAGDGDDGEEERPPVPRRQSQRNKGKLNGVIESDEEGQTQVGRYPTRSRTQQPAPPMTNGTPGGRLNRHSSALSKRAAKKAKKKGRVKAIVKDEQDDAYVDDPTSSVSGDGSLEDAPGTSPDPEEPDLVVGGEAETEREMDEQEQDGRPYSLRQRAPVNYAIPPPLEEMTKPPSPKPRGKGRNGRLFGVSRSKVPGWSATGAELSKWMGGGDDSDSDYPSHSPRKGLNGLGAPGGIFAGGAATGGMLPADFAAAGAPSNLGKVGEASLADADPLGVNQNVTFDEVGGLDDHINALKEMTLLPLLYPEVFQRFNLTPPRGVLFHGPPGTGKTLLARALAASCRSNGKGISFFMRKGADCLSKWVGEAERQLRLLFEEARNSQPSIIFFDEIDGLAPVRSSKQDQIHASIVSTLLALMDGMDGRGQVVVIGATNRPDAIDPALRRPGRFDREFYFPLPNLDSRERIVRIMTRKWAGWEGEKGEDNAKGLAKLTKGYGGADLRALCTEAALNAVQRRYPQIYKTSDRLVLQTDTINVELRDFMISVKKLVPSSARSTAPTASPLPEQLLPLLHDALDRIKAVINNVLPVDKKRTALEEAEWEDEGEEGALEREMMLQSMETLRVHRPRIVLHGPSGMGQGYVSAAALHHLEGFHVQTLDIANLMSDSTRTPEAAIVQLFVEAKRHQPSVVYIPSLGSWCAAVSEVSRTTLRAMLDGLAPTDPVLLLATVDGGFMSLPRDVRAWFGPSKENRIALSKPLLDQRAKFFEPMLKDVLRPPNQFPDGIKRKKRILEELPVAPPLEPRAPTVAELAMQQEADQKTLALLRYRLDPILTELKRKYKRFTKRASDEYNFDFNALEQSPVHQVDTVITTAEVHKEVNGTEVVAVVGQEHTQAVAPDIVEVTLDGNNGMNEAQVQLQVQVQPQLFEMDLGRMHNNLFRNLYLTPDDFLNDVRKIVHNADVCSREDPDRLLRAQAMLTAAEVSCQDFDPNFRLECQRMATRQLQRRAEHRKSKEQSRTAEEAAMQDPQTPPVRRSARNNGQAPELAITDPLKLERSLKRARSADTNGEQVEEESGELHAAKRSRVSSIEMDGQDPVIEQNGVAASADYIADTFLSLEPIFNSNPYLHPPADHQMDVVAPASNGGFDPSLLNPVPVDLPTAPNNMDAPIVLGDPPYVDPTLHPIPNGIPHPEQQEDVGGALHALIDNQEAVTVDLALTPAPEAMHIERTPTPLPEFHADLESLGQLKSELQDLTEPLSVEELEQLRAVCLARVWNHRSEWDRSPLIQELRSLVCDFVHEIINDEDDNTLS